MRTSSIRYFRALRIAALSITTIVALGYYGHVRAQNTATPPKVVPLRPLAALSTVPIPDVPGLDDYVVNKTAAIELGKSLFWDMQAGSDGIVACASCHFNAGADSRAINEVSPGIRAGDTTFQMGVHLNGAIYPNYKLNPGTAGAGFGGYHDGDFPLHKQGDVNTRNDPISDVNDIIGSQGQFSQAFDSVRLFNGTENTTVTSDSIFFYPDPTDSTKKIDTRQIEPRNTPSVINAIFNYRSFWDGRAQNTCNGANPFGDRDTTSHFFWASDVGTPLNSTLVRLQNSSLCSQALGPPEASMEMSASNRNFREIGRKMLTVDPLSGNVPLALSNQKVKTSDSKLGKDSSNTGLGLDTGYETLIKTAFQPKWWQSRMQICVSDSGTETIIDPDLNQNCPSDVTGKPYSQMEYNFSLFWGIAIQLYESTLVADQTPLDNYLSQQQTYVLQGDSLKNYYTIQLPAGVDPMTISVVELNPTLDASDQEVFGFDDGSGQVSGVGITSGTVNYQTGTLSIQFDAPPPTAYPINISYSTGPLPLTQGQLHGLLLFQTKGRCITCHGGPELSNASVGNVSTMPLERMVMGDFNVRVYDNGFYNIGTRPGTDDIGLADVDGVVGEPLSQSELERERVCNDPSYSVMVPGRPGDGVTAAPLSCSDDIAQKGFLKTPMLRDVALTAPYFHNGGQLTLEQVVEFYNRGGDFPDGFDQIPLIDPNIVNLGLTMQEKTDLVDFLRNALTDPRVVNQSAPFDHPELFVPNGHPPDPNTGYPVQNDPKNPGRATDQLLDIPATGATGGNPLPTFLQNLQTP